MKLKSIFYFLLMAVMVAFTSCDEEEVASTHTDVTGDVIGLSFSGKMVNTKTENLFCEDAVISFAEYDGENTQAVSFRFQSVSKGLDLEAVVNPAKANDDIVFSSGNKYPKLSGRLSGDALYFFVPLNKKGESLSNAATCITYRFEGVRK